MSKTESKLSSVEIANKQRHLYLLGKVKENKPLSKAELAELRRYERRTAGKITANAKLTAKVQPKGAQPPSKKKKRKAAAPAKRVKKKAPGKDGKKRRDRLPLSAAAVRRLGLENENLADADGTLRNRWTLQVMLKRFPQLRQAWDRGRLLRRLKAVASQAPSISKAAGQLGLVEQVFREMLEDDLEIADIWKEEQLKLYVETRRQVFELAADDVPWAIKIIYDLMTEHADAGMKTEINVNLNQLAELTGKTSRTIYRWFNKFGLQRNADKTFNLRVFLLWYEEYLVRKAGGNVSIPLDPLKQIKAERIRMELAKHRKELVDRDQVIVGQIKWFTNIIACFERGVEELTRLCCGQPREKIREVFKSFFIRLRCEACKIPKEFRLSMKQERELFEFLQKLKPHDSGEIT